MIFSRFSSNITFCEVSMLQQGSSYCIQLFFHHDPDYSGWKKHFSFMSIGVSSGGKLSRALEAMR